jgi:hypothetical protein
MSLGTQFSHFDSISHLFNGLEQKQTETVEAAVQHAYPKRQRSIFSVVKGAFLLANLNVNTKGDRQ